MQTPSWVGLLGAVRQVCLVYAVTTTEEPDEGFSTVQGANEPVRVGTGDSLLPLLEN